MILNPITSEKAVRLLDVENTILFETVRQARKHEIKKEIESVFSVKVAAVRTLIKGNKKYAYVRLTKDSSASDLATKLGMI